ncbi:MAG: DUF547 domain-containing protein, partial [Bacteroidota bacterium]
MRYALPILAIAALASGCTNSSVDIVRADGPIVAPDSFDHGLFNDIMMTYVDDVGLVDYGAIKDGDVLTPYLRRLAQTDPSNLDDADRLAFWLNTYNALTIKLIIDHYPTESILRLSPVGIRGLPF